ncbi:hypothetical protein EE612_036662 [Oryza sativa]|nr:hypothetical protein EE612_036662 [Oryza sativa]
MEEHDYDSNSSPPLMSTYKHLFVEQHRLDMDMGAIDVDECELPCDRPRGAHGGGAGVPRRHGACGVGMGLLPGDQPRRAAGAAARAARRTGGRVPAALPGEGDREAARLLAGELPVGNADGQVPGAAVVVGGLSHPNDDAQAQHEHQGQGGDRGGVEGDVRAGAEAGRDPDERAAGRRRGRDDGDDAGGDVLPAAEPVPTVRHGHGGAFGLCPHTDSDLLTIVHQQQGTVGGLQLLKGGRWVAVKPSPSTLIVNVGDLLQAWSNDVYKSVEHRVMANATLERFSMAFFLCPSYHTLIIPSSSHVHDDDAHYRSFTFGEYRKQIMEDVRSTGRKIGLHRFRTR